MVGSIHFHGLISDGDNHGLFGTAASRAEKMENEKHLTRKQPFLEPEKGLNEQGLVLQSSFYFLDVLNLCFSFLAFLLLLVTATAECKTVSCKY
jgi:hypothetical protein